MSEEEAWRAFMQVVNAGDSVARRKALRKWRAVRRARIKRDDSRELKAQSLACLIEAYIEMAPYVAVAHAPSKGFGL